MDHAKSSSRSTISCLALALLLAAVLCVAACGSTSAADRETTLPTATKVENADSTAAPVSAEDKFKSEVQRGDELFAGRDDRAKLKQAIAAYQSAAKINPQDHVVWAKLARATYLLADGFISFEKDENDEAMKLYLETHERGIVYAKRSLLAYSKEFQQKMQAKTAMEDAVDVLDKGAVPALYWMSSNYGKWAVAKGFTTILKYKDMIKKVMEHVLKLDDQYFHAAADRYFGAFYAKAPSFAGGDMDKSKAHFEKSLKLAPNYFGTKVLMAEFWAKKKDDRALFEKLLGEVINGDPTALPDVAPENRIEQKKAKRLMSKIDDLF